LAVATAPAGKRAFAAGEVDGNDVPAHFRRLVEDAVRHHLVVAAHLGNELADDDAVDDAEGMIGDDDLRAAARQRADRSANHLDPQIEGRDGIVPEQFRRTAEPGVVLIEPADARLAGDLLDAADDFLADGADFVRGVGKGRGRKYFQPRRRHGTHARPIALHVCLNSRVVFQIDGPDMAVR
jgi:hypothetical protein